MTKEDYLRDFVEHCMIDKDLIKVWNEFCMAENWDEDYIYTNDEDALNNTFDSVDAGIRAAFYGDYRYVDNYFIINDGGNLVSFDSEDAWKYMDLDTLVDYLKNEGNSLINEEYGEDLAKSFLHYAHEQHSKDYSLNDIPAHRDLLRDDWDALIQKMESSN